MSVPKSKMEDPSQMNGHVRKDEKEKDSKKVPLAKKVYISRNSVLTDLMEVNHLQSVYNISVAVCSLLFLNALIYYVADPAKFWQDVAIISWGSSKIGYAAIIWISLHIVAYGVYEGFRIWVTIRNIIHAKVVDALFCSLFLVVTMLMFTATPYIVLKLGIPPITAFATMNEQVRIFMKIYSFIRENVPRAKMYKPLKDGNQAHNLYPPVKHYFYYLFAPTLIYRDSYPRTEKIHWRNVLTNFLKFAAVIFITYCVFMRFNVDIFKKTGLKPFNRSEASLVFAGSMAVGAIMMFLMFYGLLHCWLNAFAEMLRFGDRQFYQDWWNSTSFSQYYRRWNNVVYDWLHAYIYMDSQKLGCSRSLSMVLVFVVSALVHEYIIFVGLGFFFPALLVVYTTIGVFVVFLTKQRTAQFWNTFMWGMLFCGWGVLVTCYSAEWYARINCPKEQVSTYDLIYPRSWDPSCHIIDFS